MKFNDQTRKQVEQDCNSCRSNFSAWLSSMDFEADYAREEDIKRQVNNYCPACRITDQRFSKK